MPADELSPQKEILATWLATPKGHRKPTKLENLAEEFGIATSTIYRWRNEPAVKLRAQQVMDEAYGGTERVVQILDALFDEAMEPGNTKQKELYMRYAGILVDRRVVENVPTELETWDEDALLAELQEGFDEEFEGIVNDIDDES